AADINAVTNVQNLDRVLSQGVREQLTTADELSQAADINAVTNVQNLDRVLSQGVREQLTTANELSQAANINDVTNVPNLNRVLSQGVREQLTTADALSQAANINDVCAVPNLNRVLQDAVRNYLRRRQIIEEPGDANHGIPATYLSGAHDVQGNNFGTNLKTVLDNNNDLNAAAPALFDISNNNLRDINVTQADINTFKNNAPVNNENQLKKRTASYLVLDIDMNNTLKLLKTMIMAWKNPADNNFTTNVGVYEPNHGTILDLFRHVIRKIIELSTDAELGIN
ncbi:MAG: hypothetical protein IJ730_04660, partial [Alphaproteobacteria bacterium]|nr:hypothetical protein [Alphaproteobacteria bacterium]